MTDASVHLLIELLHRIICPNRITTEGEVCTAIGTPDRSTWKRAIILAEKMEVGGLAYDAMTTLPREQQPESDIILHWTAMVQSTERDNLLLRKRIDQVLSTLKTEGLTPTILKGITLSELYPQPLHRPVGDVDLYVTLEEQNRYTRCFESLGGKAEQVFDLKHLSLQCLEINWELHFRSMHFYRHSTDRAYRLLELEETTQDIICHNQIGEHRVNVFPPILNQIFLTAHFQHHLLMEEVNLRQVIDWTLALHHERTSLGIKEETLIRTLNQLGLYRLYRALGYIAVQHLGLNANSYAGLSNITKTEIKRGQYLFDAILAGHLPHCKPFRPHLPTDSLKRRISHFAQLVKRCIAVRSLCPREALATPFGFLCTAIRRRLK